MDILRIFGFIIVALVALVLLRDKNKEIYLVLNFTAAAMLFIFFVLKLSDIYRDITGFLDFEIMESVFVKTIFKILGITLITQQVQSFCIDAGETSMSKNAILIGKAALIILCIPIIKKALSEVRNIMML